MHEMHLSSPDLSDDSRRLYEDAYQNADEASVAMIRVDTTLEKIRRIHDLKPSDLDSLAELAEKELSHSLSKMRKKPDYDVFEYLRLKTRLALIEPIVYANFAFAKKDRFLLRRELVNGIYGSISEILEEALLLYDEQPQADERAKLTGSINELTTLALLNRRQTPEHLALPSSITADIFNATDIDYRRFTRHSSESTKYHIQVKSNPDPNTTVMMPAGGMLVQAKDIGNRTKQGVTFPTSRAIVAEVNANTTNAHERHLKFAIQNFNDHIEYSVSESDEFFKVFNLMPDDLKQSAASIVKRNVSLLRASLNDNPDTDAILWKIE